MITPGLRSLLLAEATITDLVGQRVYVNQADQSAASPYIVISTIDTNPMLALDGTYGMRSAEIDIDCWAAGYIDAKTVAKAVLAYLADYKGAAGAVTIDAVQWIDEDDGPQSPTDGKQLGRHLVTLEFVIQFTP